jgi:DNA-binding SARP family transcriptional activator
MRIYLTGELCVETERALIRDVAWPGRQGRLVFAYLVVNRGHTVAREQLLDLLWPDGAPPSAETALSAVVSKLRGTLKSAAASRILLEASLDGYALRLPPKAWIDLEAARNAVDEAEGLLSQADWSHAWGCASVAVSIARRPFFGTDDGEWLRRQRAHQNDLLARGLHCLSTAWLHAGEPAQAATAAQALIERQPFRESAYRLLMQAQTESGDRAEAVLTYQRLRRLLANELGVDPSPATEQTYLAALRIGS